MAAKILNKETMLEVLKERANNWVPQNFLQKYFNSERIAPEIEQLRSAGWNIVNRHGNVGGKRMWEYMLVVRLNKELPGWYCSSCNHRHNPDDMKSNTLSSKHSNNYCTSCAKKRLFVLR